VKVGVETYLLSLYNFRIYGKLVFHTNCKWFGKLWNLPPDGLIIATPQFTVIIDHCNIHYNVMDFTSSCGITTPPVLHFRLHVRTFAMWFEPKAVQQCLDWKHNKLECTPNFAMRITSSYTKATALTPVHALTGGRKHSAHETLWAFMFSVNGKSPGTL
jgi:hypothetical protein